MTSQGLYKLSSLEAKEAHEQLKTVSCICADERTNRSVAFLEDGICSIFLPEQCTGELPAYFKFGSKSANDSSSFTHIPSTISACAAIDGFDVVFSQASSGMLHCLPLGDYDGTQEFIPALSFARMQGDIAQLACVPQAELLSVADTTGAIAIFSTSDAARLDYKPECCRRPITAFYASQGLLLSGDDGGEIRVWNIAEASLVPVITVSAPGQITAAIVTETAQPAGTNRGSHQIVGGTQQGDVFVWEVDLGNISEPWEPHNAQVLQVGMLSLSNTAVTLMQAIPAGVAVCCQCADNTMSRLCCLDLTNTKTPAIVANENPPHVCHMLATSTHPLLGSSSQNQLDSGRQQDTQHLLLQLWTQGVNSGISLLQHPVEAVEWHPQPLLHSGRTNNPASEIAGRSGPDRVSQMDHDLRRAADRSTNSHGTIETSISGSNSGQGAADTSHVRAADHHQVPSDRYSADVAAHRNTATANNSHDWHVHEDDAPGEFSLRALQPAKIVTVPPVSSNTGANTVASDATGGHARQGIEADVRVSRDSLGHENSFCLRSEANTARTGVAAGDNNASVGVTDSSELERRQLAELLGVVDTVSGHKEDSTEPSMATHQPIQAHDSHTYEYQGANDSEQPGAPAAASCRNSSGAHAHAAFLSEDSVSAAQPDATPAVHHSTAQGGQHKGTPVGQHSTAAAEQRTDAEKPDAMLHPAAPSENVRDAAVAEPSAREPRNSTDMSLDELRTVRERLEAMFLDPDDEIEGAAEELHFDESKPKDADLSTANAAVSKPDTAHSDSHPLQHQQLSTSLEIHKDLPSGAPTWIQDNTLQQNEPLQQPAAYDLLPEAQSALHAQFESLGITQHRDQGITSLPERSSSPQQFQVRHQDAKSDLHANGAADQLVNHLAHPRNDADHHEDDLHAPPDSPDSLRSSSVFVSGSLQHSQHPEAVDSSFAPRSSDRSVSQRHLGDHGSIDLTRQHRSNSSAHFHPGNVDSGSRMLRQSQSSESRHGHAATLNQWLSDSQSRDTGATSSVRASSQRSEAAAAFQQRHSVVPTVHDSTCDGVDISAHAYAQQQADGHRDAPVPSAEAPFSLSELAASQQQHTTAAQTPQPVDQRHSEGGISWALEVGSDRPFSRRVSPEHPGSQRSESSASVRLCGRQTGHVSASSRHHKMPNGQYTAQHTAPHGQQRQQQQHMGSSNSALQPIPRKPSTAALLRRLTRKKPTVRQILGKAPPANDSLQHWHQENGNDLSASASNPAHPRSQERLHHSISRSPAPRTPAQSKPRASSRATAHTTPPHAAHTPPSCGPSRIPVLSKPTTPSQNRREGTHAAHEFRHESEEPSSTPTPQPQPQGIILVPANPKLLHSTTRSTPPATGSASAARRPSASAATNVRTPIGHNTRRGKARSPSLYNYHSKANPTGSNTLSQSTGRKAPRRVPLQDRLNTQSGALCQVSDAQHAPIDDTGPFQHDHQNGDAVVDTENRHPSISSSRGSYQPHRKRSRSTHFRGGSSSSRTVTVTTVPASNATNNAYLPTAQHREPVQHPNNDNSGRKGRQGAHEGNMGTLASSAEWPMKPNRAHGNGGVVSEGALLQESSVSDRPPVSVSRWKVERAAGELAAHQHEFISLRSSSDQFRHHGNNTANKTSASGPAATPVPQATSDPSENVPGGAYNVSGSTTEAQGNGGLLGLLAQENTAHAHGAGDSVQLAGENNRAHTSFEPAPTHPVPSDQDAHNPHDQHPLAHPRPGAMTQLLASRIASTAAQAPPPVPETNTALLSGRKAAATIASNVPRKSTLHVAVPAVPPALAEARAAAVAAIKNGDTVGGSSVAAGALAGAAAAGTALDNLRKQSARRSGKGLRSSHINLSRSVIPPPLMDDLWKREDHVFQEAPCRPLPPPEPRTVAQVMAEVLQLHRFC